MLRRAASRVAFACAIACAATAAAAEPDAETRAAAQALFEEGRQLRAQGRCEEAVPKLAESQRLDPAVGTLLNLADCYGNLGRTASAWLHYTEAAGTAVSRGDERRVSYARERAAALEPRLMRLVVVVEEPVARGLVVKRGSQRMERAQWGSAVPVDPGTHRLVAEAPGYRPWQGAVEVDTPGETVRVSIPPLVRAPDREPQPPPAPDEPLIDAEAATIAGWTLAAAGIVGLGVGVGFAVHSRLLVDASMRYCPDDPDVCLPAGAELREDARSAELVAIVALSTGAAAVTTSVVLLIMGRSNDQGRVRAAPGGVAVAW